MDVLTNNSYSDGRSLLDTLTDNLRFHMSVFDTTKMVGIYNENCFGHIK